MNDSVTQAAVRAGSLIVFFSRLIRALPTTMPSAFSFTAWAWSFAFNTKAHDKGGLPQVFLFSTVIIIR